MLPFQQRVVKEKRQLDVKLAQLRLFFLSRVFAALDELEMLRLLEQERVMKRYSEILGERIAAFREVSVG